MALTPTPHFAYRPDIDGLRAVAVLAVVLFHLGFARLEGGFLGVDVFFVISGYLITSIIAPKMVLGTFSFKDFYLGRIRRLIPPALVTIALTFLASAFILGPAELLAMAQSAIAAVFSLSNILFFTEAGYWDAQSELKPLLHTWSLGVEEQFYLFWPLLLLAFWKLMPKQNLAWAFGIATVIGLIVSEWMLRANPSAAFYLLPARFFEFSIGATFAFIGTSAVWEKSGSRVLRLILGGAGGLMLLSAIWFYKGETPFPGMNALLPCFAAALLLLSGAGANPAPVLGRLLGNPVMTWIGRMSYSLYLVHWPVVSLMRYKVGLELHLKHQILAALLILVLTLALYYGVEKQVSSRAGQAGPAKSKPRLANGHFALGTGAAALALSAVFAHAAFNSGWTWRIDELSYSPEQVEAAKHRRYVRLPGSCVIGQFPDGKDCSPDKKLNVIVFGNSHEPDAFNFFEAGYSDDLDLQIIRFEQVNKCNFRRVNGEIIPKGLKEDCKARLDRILDPVFTSQIDILIYAFNRPFAANKIGAIDILETIKSNNPDIKILTIGGYLNVEPGCARLVNESGQTRSCADPKNVVYSPLDDKLDKLYSRIMSVTDYYLDKAALLCGEDIPASCETETPSRQPYTYDQHHLSLDFAQYAGKKFARENPNLLRELAGMSPK